MKTFKQFISESTPIQFSDFIQQNCQEYMTELDADIEVMNSPRFSLYRGLKERSLRDHIDLVLDDRIQKGHIQPVRDDRQPKDTPLQISKIVDDMLEEKFGWRPRTEGMFCYTYKNRGGVEAYGDKYKVYPMGELQFVYSPKVRDLTFQLSEWLRQRDAWPGHGKTIKDDIMLEKVIEAIKEFIEEHGYVNTNLYKAMMAEGRPEILVKCKKYLAVSAYGDN